jgi:uncharacterized protein YegP (UPF0339 family)
MTTVPPRESFVKRALRRLTPSGEKVARPRPGRYEIYRDVDGEYRWRLKAGNGEIVANSAGDGFASRWKAQRAVATAKRVALEAL